MAKEKYIQIAKKCTCGLLAGLVFCASIAEILECPIHGNKSCQTQHIETASATSGTISTSTIFPS
jgi:hypothetical protein